MRIPALLISPRIAAGTVFRASAGTIDHTSVLKTLEERWGLRGRYPEAAEGAHDDQGEIRDLGKRSGNQRPFTSPHRNHSKRHRVFAAARRRAYASRLFLTLRSSV